MNKYSKEELERLINVENKSYEEIGRIYSVTGNAIKKAAKKLGIILPQKRIINEKENFSHYRKSENLIGKKIGVNKRLNDNAFIEVINNCNSWKEICDKLGYKFRPSKNVKDSIRKRCDKLGITLSFEFESTLLDKTKGEIFSEHKNWQSARTAIRKLAAKEYFKYNNKCQCAVCGYNKCVEIAHIKAVSEFNNDATVREINNINNLIGLCPNHHWEFDHGYLKIEDIIK